MPKTTPRSLIVSFDALGTLIEVAGGVGQQYLQALQQFLASRQPPVPPVTATADIVDTVALDAIQAEMQVDRAAWVAEQAMHSTTGGLVNPKEMPLGGLTAESTLSFWRRVLHRTFHDPRVVSSTEPSVTAIDPARAAHLGIPDAEWEAFYVHVAKDVFGSSKPYAWMPDALNTLRRLAEWNAEHSPDRYLQLACPPFVVSNSDVFLHAIFADLRALSGSPPLVGGVIAAADVGRAKPSPLGLERCLTFVGLTAEEQRKGIVHVHVGDDEVDRLACEAAFHHCHYVPCDAKGGVQWEALRAKLEVVGRIA